MIQELFGGGSAPSGLLGERKICNPFSSPSSQTCPTSTPILTTTSIATTASSASLANPPNSSNAGNSNNNSNSSNNNNNSENNPSQQNLRCPRCDSTNTKFCYYNNYNLTQPRHFCKTCRRYWTKGGTLRNVPIGGGCRKNKSTAASGSSSATSGFTKSSSNAMAKAKATLSTELLVHGNPGFLGAGLLDHLHHHPDLQQGGLSNPILWPSLQQNSHILSLLRGSSNHFHNPNPSPNPLSNVFTAVKTEATPTNLGLDSYGNNNNNGAPSLLGSFPRNNQQQQQPNGFSSGVQDYAQNNNNNNGNSSNVIELYQRLKSSSNYNYCGNENQGTVIFGNMMGSSSSSPSSPMHSNILDSAPVGGGDNYGGYGFMTSPAISGWSDYPTVPINGAYP